MTAAGVRAAPHDNPPQTYFKLFGWSEWPNPSTRIEHRRRVIRHWVERFMSTKGR